MTGFKTLLQTAVLGASLALVGGAQAAQEMNLAFTPPLNSHYGDGAKAFAEEMDKLSGGEFKINLKPAGALVGERDVIEGLQIGSVELTITSTGPVGNFIPEVYALDFPFLFTSYDHARSVLDGPIGQGLLDKFQAQGLVGLAWAENGFRHVTNSVHPVNAPEDLKGLKLRTMENQVHCRVQGRRGLTDAYELDRSVDVAAAGHDRRPGKPGSGFDREQDVGDPEVCFADRPCLLASYRRHVQDPLGWPE